MKKLKLADNLINESASQAFYYMMSGGADENIEFMCKKSQWSACGL